MNQQGAIYFKGRAIQKTLFSYSIIFILALVGCKSEPGNTPVLDSIENNELENVSLYTLNNEPIDLQQYKEKTVFINFWATWCKPCIKEMPSIQKAKEILHDEEIVFLFATNDDVNEVQLFKEENTFDFNYVQVKNLEQLNVQAFPTTYIFAPGGSLQFSEAGFRKWDDAESLDLIRKISRHNDK